MQVVEDHATTTPAVSGVATLVMVLVVLLQKSPLHHLVVSLAQTMMNAAHQVIAQLVVKKTLVGASLLKLSLVGMFFLGN